MNNRYGVASAPIAPNVDKAVCDFILAYTQPLLNPSHIFKGWQNNMTLPKNSNEYAIYSVLSEERKGTNVYGYQSRKGDTGELYLNKYTFCAVQIDFYSDSDNARLRANALETAAYSGVGVDFFKKYGLCCLYAEDPKGVEYVNASDRYVKRFITTLHLSYVLSLPVEMAGFNAVNIKRIENIDTLKRR